MSGNVIELCRIAPGAQWPTRGTPGSIGLDLHACAISDTGRPNKIILPPRVTKKIRTGLQINPQGKTIMVCSRSGLASRSIFVANAPGIIDPDYRGEIFVLLYNGGHDSYYVEHGERIAQLVLLPGAWPLIVFEADSIDTNTPRGESGFGSTGR